MRIDPSLDVSFGGQALLCADSTSFGCAGAGSVEHEPKGEADGLSGAAEYEEIATCRRAIDQMTERRGEEETGFPGGSTFFTKAPTATIGTAHRY